MACALAVVLPSACGPAPEDRPSGVRPPPTSDAGPILEPDVGPRPLSSGPSSVTFVDEDPTIGQLRGMVEIRYAGGESSDLDLYFSSLDPKTQSPVRMGAPIATHPSARDGVVRFRLEAKTPAGATHLQAFRRNAAGEAKSSADTWIDDSVRKQVNATSDTSPLTGTALTYDAARDQIVGFGLRNLSAVDFYRCASDGGVCTIGGVSSLPMRTQQLSVAIDDASGSVVTVAAGQEYLDTPVVFRCPPTGTACTKTALGVPTRNTIGPAVLIDSPSAKLIVMAEQAGHLHAWRCDLDATNCVESDVSTPTAVPPTASLGLTSVRLALHEASNTVIASTRAGLFLCARDLSTCTYADYRGGRFVESASEIALDTTNGKILLTSLTRGGSGSFSETWFFRCNVDGSGCTGAKAPTLPPGYPLSNTAPWIDADAGKVIVFGGDSSAIGALRCDLDFSSCTSARLAHGPSLPGSAVPAYVPTTKHFVMLTRDAFATLLLKFGWASP